MFNIQMIEAKVAVFLISILMGFGSGFYFKSKLDTAAQARAEVKVVKQSAQNVQQSMREDTKLESSVTSENRSISNDRALEAKHLAEQVNSNSERGGNVKNGISKAFSLKMGGNCADGWTMDNYTFGLLNSARADAAYSPSDSGDAESTTTSGVTEAQFIDNDLEIVGMYNDLAKRHNALVDYVQELMKTQTK